MVKNVKKSNVLVLFIVFLLIFILFFVTIFLLSHPKTPKIEIPDDLFFYEADYDADILSDESYLSLDRSISLKQGNQTVTIEKDFISDNGTIEFMIDYLDCIICGDYQRYSDFFSELYFDFESVPEKFTMQRVYDITIETLTETVVTDSNKNYTEYRLSLDYKINRNDGTLRNDMESDCTRKQYFLITDREGALKIDTIKSYYIVDDIPSEIPWSALIMIFCFLIFILIVCAMIIKKNELKHKNADKNISQKS